MITRLLRKIQNTYIPYLLFSGIFLSIGFKYSNWNKNPVQVEQKSDQNKSNDYWKRANFPQNVKTILPVSSYLIFAGTNDGKIYMSYGNGASWVNYGITKDTSAINFFYYLESIFPNQPSYSNYYAIAGTRNGIYFSFDRGLSWQESVIKNIENPKIEINSIMKGYAGYLYAFGKDNGNNPGKLYNCLSSPDNGKSWYPDTSMKIGNRNCISVIYIGNGAKTIIGINDEIGSSICSIDKTTFAGIFDFPKGIELFSLVLSSDGQFFAGTNKGIYKSSNPLNGWAKSGLDDIEVKFIGIGTNNQVITGTKKGIYVFFDKGII